MTECYTATLPVPLPGREVKFSASGLGRCFNMLSLLARAMNLPVKRYSLSGKESLVEIMPFDGSESSPGWLRANTSPRFPGDIRINIAEERIRFGLKDDAMSVPAALFAMKRCTSLGIQVLNDRNLSLLHGAMLELPGDECVIVFGDSGSGKSTSARRFSEQGGNAPADDLMLLCRDGDGEFWTQPLPTWSTWRNLSDGKSVDSSRLLRVRGMLLLSRGTGDRILPSEAWRWKSCLVRALSIHALGDCEPYLPGEFQNRIISRFMAFADQLQQRFGCYELAADLNSRSLLERIQGFAMNEKSIVSAELVGT